VEFNELISDVIVISTGGPQGCVLSPLLYSLFTNDCTSSHPSVKMTKFADDTTLCGLVKNADESDFRQEVSSLVEWCDNNNLLLNPSKTKEIVVDFRKKKTHLTPLMINGENIERVSCFKFLGNVISEDLKWEENIKKILKN
jgi:hypothetical protein